MSIYTDFKKGLQEQANIIQNDIESAVSAVSQTKNKKASSGTQPWKGDKDADDVFFPPIELKPDRWNRLFPYRLLVVDVKNPRQPKVYSKGSRSTGTITGPQGQQNIDYVISQEAEQGKWEVVLPITPQQLTIQDQFSIQTSATMRGIIEEHNGVKFKMINIAGTTGIWPKRPTIEGNLKQPSSFASIFAGSIDSLGQIGDSARRLRNAFTGKHPNNPEKAVLPNESAFGDFSTGYYQAMYLGQFLERYAQLKKNPKAKNLRLVFDIPKQNQSFIVTPMAFNFNQNQQRPNEMLYTIQLKAWKRINLKGEAAPIQDRLPSLGDPNLYQQISNTIASTRRVLANAIDLVKAVRSDFQGPFNVLRQTALAVKDVAGLVQNVSELPNQVISDARSAIEESINTAEISRLQIANTINKALAGGSFQSGLTTNTGSQSQKAGNVVNAIKSNRNANEGLSREQVASGALGQEAAQRQETDPLNNIFENPEENFEFFNAISLDNVNLTLAQQEALDNEVVRASLLTVDDFRQYKEEMKTLALEISNTYGSGDVVYSQIYQRPQPKERSIELSVEENEVMLAIWEMVEAYDLLTATKRYDDAKIRSSLEYVGGLANEAGIDFDENIESKILVPVPFGLTIEEIAARYLQDPDRWIEIATINNLRSPYIDEEGFTLNLLSNADGRQLNVNDEEKKLYVGQTVLLQSTVVPQFARRIINIERISETNTLVTLDGADDLTVLTTSDGASLRGFLPGTINSQNQIYIPIDAPSQEDDRVFEIPRLDNANLTKISKVDFLLDDNFDVAINSLGDIRLSNGLTNLIQAMKLKIRTKKGSLLRHLDYGLGLKHGISVADVETGALIDDLNAMIESDDRYDFIESANFSFRGSSLIINMSIRLANNTGVVPITFDAKIG